MKKYFMSVFLAVLINFSLSAVELKNSSDVIKQIKFVDVFLWSVDDDLKQEEKDEAKQLRNLMVELRPYVRRLQTYGYILDPTALRRVLGIYTEANQLFEKIRGYLKQNTQEECKRIFGRLEPVKSLMQRTLGIRLQRTLDITYPFIKSCFDSQNPEEDPLYNFCKEYFHDKSNGEESCFAYTNRLEDGNVLVYLSELGERTIIVELCSSFFAHDQQIKKRKEYNDPTSARLILRPIDVVLLSNGCKYEVIEPSSGTLTIKWSDETQSVIDCIYKEDIIDEGNINKNINKLSQFLLEYLKLIYQQLSKEEPLMQENISERERSVISEKGTRVAGDTESKSNLELVETIFGKISAKLKLQLLKSLLIIGNVKSITQAINLECNLECKNAISFANRALHTEVQCIALSLRKVFYPKGFLYSLKNPCFSCFRLPYIMHYSKEDSGFFLFMFKDDVYRKMREELLKKQSSPTLARQGAADLQFRTWHGLEKTAGEEVIRPSTTQ